MYRQRSLSPPPQYANSKNRKERFEETVQDEDILFGGERPSYGPASSGQPGGPSPKQGDWQHPHSYSKSFGRLDGAKIGDDKETRAMDVEDEMPQLLHVRRLSVKHPESESSPPVDEDDQSDGEQEPALVTIRPAVCELSSSCRKLQEELSGVESECVVKSAPSASLLPVQELTFAGIAEQVRGSLFQLQMWETAAGIRDLEDIHINGSGAEVLDAAARILQRLVESARDLKDTCVDARPQDLTLTRLPEVSDAELEHSDDDESEDESGEDLTERRAFFIQSQLQSLQLNMQSLAILLRPVQDLSPSYNAEKAELQKLVEEAHRYFGSPKALARYAIDPKFAGRKALEEARYVARRVDSRRGR